MMKNVFLVLLGLAIAVLLYFIVLRPETTSKQKSTTSEKFTATSEVSTDALDNKICAQLSNQSDVPAKIDFIDVKSTLVFCENDIGVMPVLVNKDFTEVKKAFHALDFGEFKEELADRGYIAWQADSEPKGKFSLISGFATDKVRTIIINSENDTVPNRLYIRDNLWFWYYPFAKEKVNMPVKVTAYDADGNDTTEGFE
ncbi:hypothetical protein [Bacillus sp. FJAT-49736]|uniref:hypothetical protein n=1 Tax=Bacillus sp. FJAT-49736 TaxID=2833582 RepID=UPI001BC990F5|nr:hypothetical protein [Bacillus sp. FJAT-49736]MBS4175079.1 hypothetical protein [Bacillus sp. FJAT-49736]